MIHERTDELDLIKIKTFCSVKESQESDITKHRLEENTGKNTHLDKGMVSKIYK